MPTYGDISSSDVLLIWIGLSTLFRSGRRESFPLSPLRDELDR
jgi:hypothetical protein